MSIDPQTMREMAIARDVQRRLLPQSAPKLETLEIAACCVQARSVGGDFYDFLDLAGQTGMVLANVSGKGFHAALLMVNLQAHVRSQCSAAPQDPLRAMRQVNQMLLRSTDPGHFATLFLGVYAERSRRLSYINCGHNPPLCLRADGRIEWLAATATVIGAFDSWQCALGRTTLGPGDLLVAYSDGVTEARGEGEYFGEDRLIEVAREHAGRTAEQVLATVLSRVQEFSAGEQSDDLTLLVARAR